MNEDFIKGLAEILNNFNADYIKGDCKVKVNDKLYSFEYSLSSIEPVDKGENKEND